MRITNVQPNLYSRNFAPQNLSVSNSAGGGGGFPDRRNSASIPVGYNYGVKIHFGEFFDPNRTVPHIDYEEYVAMQDTAKRRFRRRYSTFEKTVNATELAVPEQKKMPLQDSKLMDEFIATAKIYNQYKDQPIICLGRSPKWFLNASLWMEDGIKDYKFVAFSGAWHNPHPRLGMVRKAEDAPTEAEEIAYRKYLKRVKADPQSIVDNMEKTGKPTIITDYICTGRGITSFLDVMSRYADDLGILEQFSKSIEIVGIGSMEYMERLDPYADDIPIPRAYMPEKLKPYWRNIEQKFYDMDYMMFKEMLLNQNTNECRSTYYPHEMWTKYKPDHIKTGMIKDPNKVKLMVAEAKSPKKVLAHFTPAMFDFRNLLNFHILDALNQQNLLKLVHHSRL